MNFQPLKLKFKLVLTGKKKTPKNHRCYNKFILIIILITTDDYIDILIIIHF